MVHRLLRRFSEISLTKRFAVVSFIILLIGMLVIGWWVTQQIEAGVMNRTASVTASFVTSSVSPHLQSIGETGKMRPEETAALDKLLLETELGQTIVSFKVWSLDGRILYSPSQELIGKTFPIEPELQKVFQGETISHITDLSSLENDYERERFSELVETYTPLRLFGTGEIMGAVEFYEGTGPLVAAIQDARLKSWFVVGVATLVMYLVLLGMVKGASLTIDRQRGELAQAAAQQELDRMKAEFVSAVSHELRTPLGFIKGYATTLLRDDIPVDPDIRLEFLHVIDEETEKLQRMIDDLLDASRLQARRLQMRLGPVSLRELLENALRKVASRLAQAGHVLEPRLPLNDTKVIADAGRIEQVLHNLLDNAMRYSDSGSGIEVEAVIQDQYVLVSVKDHGDGIPAQEQERIFESFYRGVNSRRRSAGGTGLGLPICRGIIESHGGELWVESSAGVGSTFMFTLPLEVPQDTETSDQEHGLVVAPTEEV
ncbi:MAG: sensor histidine kinase [Dehalococcoidia bacterium]